MTCYCCVCLLNGGKAISSLHAMTSAHTHLRLCRFSTTYTPLNLYRLKQCIDSGRLASEGVITMKDLRDSGTIHRKVRDGVKLLGGVSTLSL